MSASSTSSVVEATTSTTLGSVLGKRDATVLVDNDEPPIPVDADVGICTYMDDLNEVARASFDGSLKERFSDFVVQEV